MSLEREDLRELGEMAAVGVLWITATAIEIVLLTLAIYATGHWILGVW